MNKFKVGLLLGLLVHGEVLAHEGNHDVAELFDGEMFFCFLFGQVFWIKGSIQKFRQNLLFVAIIENNLCL